jgi:hypothetical protein
LALGEVIRSEMRDITTLSQTASSVVPRFLRLRGRRADIITACTEGFESKCQIVDGISTDMLDRDKRDPSLRYPKLSIRPVIDRRETTTNAVVCQSTGLIQVDGYRIH